MLSLEPLLDARLADIPGIKGVHGLPELLAAESASKPSPCLYLIYDGYRVLESSASGASARIEVRWLVVVSVKRVGQNTDGAPARAAALPFVQAVLGRLLGWSPGGGHGPLKLSPAPRSDFFAGALLFPLAFTTVQVVKG